MGMRASGSPLRGTMILLSGPSYYVYGLVPILVLLMLHYDTMGIAHVYSQNDVYFNVKF